LARRANLRLTLPSERVAYSPVPLNPAGFEPRTPPVCNSGPVCRGAVCSLPTYHITCELAFEAARCGGMLTAIAAAATAEPQYHDIGNPREALQASWSSPLQPVAGPQQSSQRRDAASPAAMKGFAATPMQMGLPSGARPAAPSRDPTLAGLVAQSASSSSGSSSSSDASSSSSSSDPTGA
jgi:hypothetical protein